MAVANSGWSRADLRPLMELVLPSEGGHLEDVRGQRLDAGNARPASANKNPGPQAVQQSQLGQFRFDQLEGFLQAQRHDAAEVFEVDDFGGHPQVPVVG